MPSENLQLIRYPELIIGVAGPIGVQMDWVVQSINSSLAQVGYIPRFVKLTAEMAAFPTSVEPKAGNDYHSEVLHKMNYATSLCRVRKNTAFLAAVAIIAIQRIRREITGSDDKYSEKTAYVVRQFKRPDEIELLRRVYGKQFILISAYGSRKDRLSWIIEQIKRHLSADLTGNEIEKRANDLIDRDADENLETYGQHLRDTFHMADLFVDGMDKGNTQSTIDRFFSAFFGKTDITPSKREYGMYAAKSASLRSSDLSRQVGAAIFSASGELITQGCNEVPKAFGGTYWDSEKPDFRDIKIGHDPNQKLTNEILKDLFKQLHKAGYLSDQIMNLPSTSDIVQLATKRASIESEANGPLVGAQIMDLTEYGRVVHAEMSAICDAARTGKKLKDSVLYCTTFPCHNCAKHIVAAGISEVVYMEPYPKSRVKDLHEHEIEIDERTIGRVCFIPFIGISPSRYRDIFQKGRRKDATGTAKEWMMGSPQPMVEVVFPSYIKNEDYVQTTLVVDFASVDSAEKATEPK